MLGRLSPAKEALLRAQLRGVFLPDIVPRNECGQPYCPPDIETFCNLDGLGYRVSIYDPAPAKCSVCGGELFGGGLIDCTGMTFEEERELEWELENVRSVRPCETHPGAAVIWPPSIHIRVRLGEPAAEVEFEQGGKPVNPTQLSREGMSLLVHSLMRLEQWSRAVEQLLLANADRDPGDESPFH